MAVAAVAARSWREAQVEVSTEVRGRLDAIWVDAYRAAVATIAPERDRLAGEVEELRGEDDARTATVEDVETERDKFVARVEDSEQVRATAVSECDEAAARASVAEDRTESVGAERDRLAEQVRALIERISSATATRKIV